MFLMRRKDRKYDQLKFALATLSKLTKFTIIQLDIDALGTVTEKLES